MNNPKQYTLSKLTQILDEYPIETVLDIGAGKGLHSLLAAENWCVVDAVDNRILPHFSLDDKVLEHEKITFHDQAMEKYTFTTNYDLVVCLNSIMFMEKDFVVNSLLPDMHKVLTDKGILFLGFLIENEDLAKFAKRQRFYTKLEILDLLTDFTVVEDYVLSKNSLKNGENILMESQILLLQKN